MLIIAHHVQSLTMNINPQQKLAYELASALSDLKSLGAYEALTERYSEAWLREVLLKVLSVPEEKILKSRGALFTSIVKRYGFGSKHSRG